MGQSAPPSPAPSVDGHSIPGSSMSPTVSANTSHPREGAEMVNVMPAYVHPQSRYSTPMRDDDFSHYDPNSAYTQPTPEIPFAEYPVGHDLRSSPYDGIHRDATYPNNRVPYTPEASPPTPCAVSDPITTRSGLSVPQTMLQKTLRVKAGRVAKKSREPKQRVASTVITKPLSEIAKGLPDVPVADIAAFVARSTEERLSETSRNKKAGQIKRPMNAFMLYRKAYQDVAKTQCAQNNHQHVSKVCGAGWPLEPDHVHEMFNEWARLERSNHQKAHPGYKFTPAKPKKARRDGETDDDSAVLSDPDDSDWASSHGVSRPATRPRTTRQPSRLSEPPSIVYDSYDQVDGLDVVEGGHSIDAPYESGMYAYPTPGRPHSVPYGPAEVAHYDLALHQNPNALGIVMQDMISRTPSPGLDYGLPPVDGTLAYFDGAYRGNEPAFVPMADPSLLPGAQYGIYDGISREASVPLYEWPHLGGGSNPGAFLTDYDDGGDHDAYLRGKQEDWKIEELDEASQFESWITQTEQGRM